MSTQLNGLPFPFSPQGIERGLAFLRSLRLSSFFFFFFFLFFFFFFFFPIPSKERTRVISLFSRQHGRRPGGPAVALQPVVLPKSLSVRSRQSKHFLVFSSFFSLLIFALNYRTLKSENSLPLPRNCSGPAEGPRPLGPETRGAVHLPQEPRFILPRTHLLPPSTLFLLR